MRRFLCAAAFAVMGSGLVGHAGAAKPATDSPECIAAVEPAITRQVARDYASSVPTIKRLADSGCARAQLFLGLMYIDADGVNGDCHKGTGMVQDLANRFYVDAQVFLARLHEHGRCTRSDPIKAYLWYAIAASHPQASDGRAKARTIRRGRHVLMSEAEIAAGDASAIAWWKARWR